MKASGQYDLTVLGIESSCDDTAVAVVHGRQILSNVVSSQDAVHSPYGGIVPELASRQHIQNILPLVDDALVVVALVYDATKSRLGQWTEVWNMAINGKRYQFRPSL